MKHFHVTRMLVAELLPSLRWRHHANGFLVADIVPEKLQVQLWHEELIVHEDSALHGHHRKVDTLVLVGEVENTPYFMKQATSHANASSTHHAFVYEGGPLGGLTAAGYVTLEKKKPRILKAGESYGIQAYVPHQERSALAATLVTLGEAGSDWASVFTEEDAFPRQDFEHETGLNPRLTFQSFGALLAEFQSRLLLEAE